MTIDSVAEGQATEFSSLSTTDFDGMTVWQAWFEGPGLPAA
jgi:hypothetical protein